MEEIQLHVNLAQHAVSPAPHSPPSAVRGKLSATEQNADKVLGKL